MLSNGSTLSLTGPGVTSTTFSPVEALLHVIKDQQDFAAPGSTAFSSIVANGFSDGPAIPEPSTWVMLMLGCPRLGCAAFPQGEGLSGFHGLNEKSAILIQKGRLRRRPFFSLRGPFLRPPHHSARLSFSFFASPSGAVPDGRRRGIASPFLLIDAQPSDVVLGTCAAFLVPISTRACGSRKLHGNLFSTTESSASRDKSVVRSPLRSPRGPDATGNLRASM